MILTDLPYILKNRFSECISRINSISVLLKREYLTQDHAENLKVRVERFINSKLK